MLIKKKKKKHTKYPGKKVIQRTEQRLSAVHFMITINLVIVKDL